MPAPWGYSPVVRPADVAGHSRSRPGWPRCPSWGVPPGAGICCPGWVSPPGLASAALVGCLPQGRPPLPWLGVPPRAGLRCPGWVCPPGPASAASVGVSSWGTHGLQLAACAHSTEARLPGGGLTAVPLLPCMSASPCPAGTLAETLCVCVLDCRAER